MATRGSYVHDSMVTYFLGEGIQKMLVVCNFLKILMVSDKMIHRAFSTHTTLLTKPIREIFHFHDLPKLYIGFNSIWYNNSLIKKDQSGGFPPPP